MRAVIGTAQHPVPFEQSIALSFFQSTGFGFSVFFIDVCLDGQYVPDICFHQQIVTPLARTPDIPTPILELGAQVPLETVTAKVATMAATLVGPAFIPDMCIAYSVEVGAKADAAIVEICKTHFASAALASNIVAGGPDALMAARARGGSVPRHCSYNRLKK